MTDNNQMFDADQLYSGVRGAVGQAIEEATPAFIGWIDSLGNPQIKVNSAFADEQNKYYFTFGYSTDLAEASSFGEVYNVGATAIEDRYIGFGTPIWIRRDGNEWYMAGLRARAASGFIGSISRPTPTLPGAVQTQVGLLDMTDPPSMRAVVFGAPYTLDHTFYDVPTLYTPDLTSHIPATDGQAVNVCVQVDVVNDLLVVTYGEAFDAALSVDQAWVADGGSGVIFPVVDGDKFRAGFVRLVAGMTAITRSLVWAVQELYSKTIYADIIVAAGEVVTDGDEVTYL